MDDQDLLVLPSPGIPGIPRRRSSHTYVRRDLASPRNFVREIRCGSGALSVRDAEGLGRRLRFRGLPFAPVYNDDRAENGYLAGHAHPHYTIEEARGPPRRVVVDSPPLSVTGAPPAAAASSAAAAAADPRTSLTVDLLSLLAEKHAELTAAGVPAPRPPHPTSIPRNAVVLAGQHGSGKTTFLNSHQQSCADHAAIELRFAAELRKVPPAASTSTAGGAAPPKVIVLERRLAEQAPASAPSPGAAGSADAAPGAAAEDAAAADMVADAIAAAELLEALFEPVPAGCEFSLDRFERFAGQRNRGKLRAILRETTRRLGCEARDDLALLHRGPFVCNGRVDSDSASTHAPTLCDSSLGGELHGLWRLTVPFLSPQKTVKCLYAWAVTYRAAVEQEAGREEEEEEWEWEWEGEGEEEKGEGEGEWGEAWGALAAWGAKAAGGTAGGVDPTLAAIGRDLLGGFDSALRPLSPLLLADPTDSSSALPLSQWRLPWWLRLFLGRTLVVTFAAESWAAGSEHAHDLCLNFLCGESGPWPAIEGFAELLTPAKSPPILDLQGFLDDNSSRNHILDANLRKPFSAIVIFSDTNSFNFKDVPVFTRFPDFGRAVLRSLRAEEALLRKQESARSEALAQGASPAAAAAAAAAAGAVESFPPRIIAVKVVDKALEYQKDAGGELSGLVKQAQRGLPDAFRALLRQLESSFADASAPPLALGTLGSAAGDSLVAFAALTPMRTAQVGMREVAAEMSAAFERARQAHARRSGHALLRAGLRACALESAAEEVGSADAACDAACAAAEKESVLSRCSGSGGSGGGSSRGGRRDLAVLLKKALDSTILGPVLESHTAVLEAAAEAAAGSLGGEYVLEALEATNFTFDGLGPALANHEQRSCFRPGPTHPPEANRPLAAVLSPLLAAVGHFCVGLPARAEGHDDVKAVVDRVLFGRTPVPLSGASAAGGQQPRKGGLLRGAFVQRVSSLRAEGGSTAAAAPPPPPTPQQHTGVPGNSNTAVSCLFALRLESALLNAVGEVLKPFATFGPEDFIHGIFRCGLAVAGMSLNDPPAAGGGNGANSDSDDPAAAAAFAWPEPAQSLTIAADDALRAVGRGGGREKFDRRNKELAARAAGVVSCVAQSHGALFRGFLEGIRDEVVARAVASVRGACAEVGGGPPVPPSSLLGGGRRRRDEAILEILTDIVRIFADHSVACGPDFASLAPPPPPPPLLPAPASAGGEGAAADGGNAPSSTAAAASGGRRGRRITRALTRGGIPVEQAKCESRLRELHSRRKGHLVAVLAAAAADAGAAAAAAAHAAGEPPPPPAPPAPPAGIISNAARPVLMAAILLLEFDQRTVSGVLPSVPDEAVALVAAIASEEGSAGVVAATSGGAPPPAPEQQQQAEEDAEKETLRLDKKRRRMMAELRY